MHDASFVADLAVVLGVAAGTAVLARRLRQPSVLGYLFAGLLVGPYLPVPLFADPDRVEGLAEFGVVLVMFAVGLELRLTRLARVLPISGVTGLVQVGVLIWGGYGLAQSLGWTRVEALFLGGSIAISSTMVVSRVLDRSVGRDVREHIFGILVVQDVLAIALIAGLTAVARGGGLEAGALFLVLVKLAAVLLGLVLTGLLLVPRLVRHVCATRSPELLAVVALGLCFAFGALAQRLGYSVALGAFVAGVLVAESGEAKKIEHLVAPLRDVFAAVFFVSIGMTVDPLQAVLHLPTSLLVAALVVGGQLVSVSLAGVLSGNGLRRSVFAGLALGQIGEFGFIIATVGVSAGVVRPEIRPILVTVAVITAFTTGLALARADVIARALDHRLPPGLLQLLGLYERWFERWRNRPVAVGAPATPAARSLRNAAFDGFAAVAGLGLALSWQNEAAEALAAWTSAPLGLARLVYGAAALAALSPLFVGLIRNTFAFSAIVADEIALKASDDISPTRSSILRAARPGEHLARRLIRSTLHLLVALGVGVPALAVLRPLAPGPWALPVLALVVLAIGLALRRDVRDLDAELRSGAAAVAERLAQELGTVPPGTIDLADGPTLPGLDAVKGWRIPAEAFGIGRSLAELDVRAASGVAIVTIQRGDNVLGFPRGSERLQAGDVLGLLGNPEALAEAQSLLLEGPSDKKR